VSVIPIRNDVDQRHCKSTVAAAWLQKVVMNWTSIARGPLAATPNMVFAGGY